MNDNELRARLIIKGEETPIEKTPDEVFPAPQKSPVEEIISTSYNVLTAAEQVMKSYQDANKWLDSIKEFLLMNKGCVFFSQYIHNLAHTMPARFDKFGDILHTMDMIVPYPTTHSIDSISSDLDGIFIQIFDILNSICNSLKSFSEVAQTNGEPAAALHADELLVDITSEYTHLYRMKRVYFSCNDEMKFDTWVAQYVNNLSSFID